MTALEDDATMLVTIWKIIHKNGVTVLARLTDLDVPLVVNGETYTPNGSTDRSSIKMNVGLGADNLDIKGVLGIATIDEDGLREGRYDYAQLEVSLAFANLNIDPIPLGKGRFGEVTVDNGAYAVEINGPTFPLQATVGEVTTPTCRADFGDARCTVSLASWRHTYTLAAVPNGRTLTLGGATQLPVGGSTYNGGLVEVMDGPAVGLFMEIRSAVYPQLTLYQPFVILPEGGDTVRVTVGCSKQYTTCRDVFSNGINFQGEKDVPGIDSMLAPGVE